MVLKETLPIPRETAVANYNFNDVAQNTGVVVFFGGAMEDDSAQTYRLDENAFDPWHTRRGDNGDEENSGRFRIVTFTSGTSTSVLDLDFDTSAFNLPRTVNGNILVNIPWSFDPGVSTDKIEALAIVRLRRVRGGDETEIASGTSKTQGNLDDGVSFSDGMFSFTFAVTNALFKKDDTLRISVEIFVRRSAGSGSCAFLMMTDPLARDVAVTGGSSANDQIKYDGGRALRFLVPFKLDL